MNKELKIFNVIAIILTILILLCCIGDYYVWKDTTHHQKLTFYHAGVGVEFNTARTEIMEGSTFPLYISWYGFIGMISCICLIFNMAIYLILEHYKTYVWSVKDE